MDEKRGLIAREVAEILVYSPGPGARTFNAVTVEIQFREPPVGPATRDRLRARQVRPRPRLTPIEDPQDAA
jgi:hypothetical protein